MVNESLAGSEEIVDGVYALGAPIRRSARSAIYETVFGEGESAVPAVIRIREVEPEEAEDPEQRLRDAGRLEHPNLLKIYAAGSSILNGVRVVYAVMERADESLEGALEERALSESETREMLAPLLDALGYLHKEGYAHSRLRPSNVMAVKDRLKLSTDRVIRANDGEAADDMRALGILIFQTLTQRMPNADRPWGSQEFDGIPQPLADIVRHCLDPYPATRWNVEQVRASLCTPLVSEEKPRSPNSAVGEEAPVTRDPKTGFPKWIFAGLAGVILIVILAAIVRNRHPEPVAAPRVTAIAPRRTAPASAQTPQPVTPHALTAPSDMRKASGWSVIVGAYGSREAAEKRMREMAKRWPKFEINVDESRAEKTPYLVVLGRNLSEDQAQALRRRAVQSGLPRDTYIKRAM